MSLPSLQLDDLTWTGMVDGVRARIIANSDGQWTMHGPLDPGVALLELFAYQFEQRLYWLDQVSEPLIRSFLALLDDAPPTTSAAKTLLAFQSLEDNSPQHVREGTVFYPRDHDLPLPFTTLEPVTVLPVGRVGAQLRVDLVISGKDRTSDLRAGRLPKLLPADGSAAEFQFVFWMARPLGVEEIGGKFSLFLDLRMVSGILPEWAPLGDDIQWSDRVTPSGYARRIVDPSHLISDACHLAKVDAGLGVPQSGSIPSPSTDPANWISDFVSRSWSEHQLIVEAPAKLTWLYSTGVGTKKTFASDQLADATGGLRRSGLVRIRIPADWQPIATAPDGAAAYAVWVTCDACTFAAPPQLRRVAANVAIAQQLEAVELDWEELKPQLDEWLRLPRQKIALDEDKPEPSEKSVHLQLREADGWQEWRPTDDFYHHGPEDRVFVVDRLRKQLLFGNGLNGRIPTLDDGPGEYGKLCYHAGGGSLGNVGELLWVSSDTELEPRNIVPGMGGAEAKTIPEARAGTGRALSRRERAVTTDDFEWLAISTPGVAIARAHAAVGYHPDFSCYPVPGAITVFVVPRVPRDSEDFETGEAVLAPTTDAGALAEVGRRLDARRLVTSEVHVRSARYRGVSLVVELQGVLAGEKNLRTKLALLLTAYLDPLIGGDHGDGWPFGGPLRSSSFSKLIQAHLEEGVFVKRVAIALEGQDGFEDCRDVPIGAHELVYLKELAVRIDSKPTTRGGLR